MKTNKDNKIEEILGRFDEKFYKSKETPLGGRTPIVIPDTEKIKSFIKKELQNYKQEILDEVIEWLHKRCENNIKGFGTDKWNSDMEDLIDHLEDIKVINK